MKFFHIADLHFGKSLHNVQLIEKDQPYWVEQFLAAVDTHQPDAVVIAGDIYDRMIPSPDAMKLFDHLLTELAKRDKYVFVIPGNHDSSVRLSHFNGLLTAHKIHIAGEHERELKHVTVTVPSDSVSVTFWLMPFVFPKLISEKIALDQKDLSSYDAAVRALLAVQDIDENACNVLVAHQNVLANGVSPEHSGSEAIIIGGLGEIDVSAFHMFDYVALGHIHNAQHVGIKTVRYAGCPLYYDFSEIKRKKGLTLVTVHSKSDIQIEQIDIPILHRLWQEDGTLEALLSAGDRMENKDHYYIQCIVRDKFVPPRALDQLRNVFGDQLVNVKREFDEENAEAPEAERNIDTIQSIEDQFSLFYQKQKGKERLDENQKLLVKKAIEQQSRHGDYITDATSVPAEDSQELLDVLLETMEDQE